MNQPTNRKLLHIVSVLLITMCIPSKGYSQGGYTAEFSRIGFSPVGISMGNAMTASTHYSGLSYYNPAQAAIRSSKIPLQFSSALMQFDRQLHMVSANFQLPPSAGLSFSLINARTTDIDGRNLSGYHTGYLSTTEYRLSGAFGIRFSENIMAGIGINFNHSNLHEDIPAIQGIGVDLGLIAMLTENASAGISIQNLLSSRSVNTTDLYGTDASPRSDEEPLRLIAGISYMLSEELRFNLDYENRYQFAENMSHGSVREEVRTDVQFIRSGIDYALHERVSLRGGLIWDGANDDQKVQPSAGFSVHLPLDSLTPSIDYAFAAEPSGISSMHVFGLRVKI